MSSTQIVRYEPNGVVFSDPTDPDFTVRFKQSSTQKTLNGIAVKNNVTEIIINDQNLVTVGNTPLVDSLSVRIKVSGAVDSAERLGDILGEISTQIPTWINEHVFQGFNPATAPVNPS